MVSAGPAPSLLASTCDATHSIMISAMPLIFEDCGFSKGETDTKLKYQWIARLTNRRVHKFGTNALLAEWIFDICDQDYDMYKLRSGIPQTAKSRPLLPVKVGTGKMCLQHTSKYYRLSRFMSSDAVAGWEAIVQSSSSSFLFRSLGGNRPPFVLL